MDMYHITRGPARQTALFVVEICLLAGYLHAQDTIYTDKNGRALLGFDPVAYFVSDTAMRGDTGISYEWAGAIWTFASEENRDRFKAAPEKYVPKYGGYCAYGVKWGRKVPTDPHNFAVVAGTLYLNLNREVNERWLRRREHNIKKADRKWPRVKKKDPDW